MLKISEAASLALHTMALLVSREGRVMTTREIAGKFEASEAHLAKVLQRLVKAGYVRSVRGPRGGFLLSPRGAKASLLEVYESIEGPIPSRSCLFDAPVCDGTSCILGGLLETVNRDVRAYLSGTQLSELAHSYDSREKETVHAAEDRSN